MRVRSGIVIPCPKSGKHGKHQEDTQAKQYIFSPVILPERILPGLHLGKHRKTHSNQYNRYQLGHVYYPALRPQVLPFI